MPKALFICGTPTQARNMHNISLHLYGFECYFTPVYDDGIAGEFANNGVLEFSYLSKRSKREVENFLIQNRLNIDHEKRNHEYDLVFTCSDLAIPKNLQRTPIVLVKDETEKPKGFAFQLYKYFGLPRFLVGLSAIGFSDSYDLFFVPSETLKKYYIKNGIKSEKILVASNFSHVDQIEYQEGRNQFNSAKHIAQKSIEFY